MPASHPQLVFGFPRDPLALTALAVGLGLLALAVKRARFRPEERKAKLLVALLAAMSAGLSTIYFDYYLRGAPRVIDATAYLLEARIFETLSFTFTPPDPISLFRGRFLTSPPSAPDALGVIFPPGYPAILALGEALGSYRLVGPSLAALLVLATYDLARLTTKSVRVGCAAALFSSISMALRYHTADTMSHGWSALLVTVAASSYLRLRGDSMPAGEGARRSRRPSPPKPQEAPPDLEDAASADFPRLGRLSASRERIALLLGGVLGVLIATRQLTGLLTALVLGGHSLLARTSNRRTFREAALVVVGMLPGLALLGFHQKALTGSFFVSPQLAYYRASDGPLGCFGLGFGTGCEFEHGDFFRATQGEGLSLVVAARTTLRRLAHHSLDIANFEPLALVAAAGLWKLRNRGLRSLALSLLLVFFVGYASFYFDGSYPGGGARFFLELLPVEHVALAALLVERECVWLGLAASLLGFALHGRGTHELLDASQGGRPFLTAGEFPLDVDEPRLLFVESDHALLLGLVPRNFESTGKLSGPLVARATGDAREGALLRRLHAENPSLQAFRLDPRAAPGARISALATASEGAPPGRIEAESLWPALAQRGGWAHPSFPPESCASRGRALVLHPAPRGAASAPTIVDLWVDGPPPGRYEVEAGFVRTGRGCERTEVGVWTLPGTVRVVANPPDFGSLHLDWLEVSAVAERTELPPNEGPRVLP